MLWGGAEEFESDKAKNVRQTEILVDLREAILQVARHFQSIDPKNSHVVRTFMLPADDARSSGDRAELSDVTLCHPSLTYILNF